MIKYDWKANICWKVEIKNEKVCYWYNTFLWFFKAKKASSVITYQLVKSATSTGANYRAACRARSKKEFFSKLCVVVEEADESVYWLELIKETGLSNNPRNLENVRKEAIEITKILGKAKNSIYAI